VDKTDEQYGQRSTREQARNFLRGNVGRARQTRQAASRAKARFGSEGVDHLI